MNANLPNKSFPDQVHGTFLLAVRESARQALCASSLQESRLRCCTDATRHCMHRTPACNQNLQIVFLALGPRCQVHLWLYKVRGAQKRKICVVPPIMAVASSGGDTGIPTSSAPAQR
ncbi:unnamed protein product [Symbiodinium natans]|uniref:Uncharacterized protein n=1 Tax=Symbiodinium natans TaxID=878477 RepID=A0A812Q3F2_9DINO|nr:unnamed protein product [Symbiodinium natans]